MWLFVVIGMFILTVIATMIFEGVDADRVAISKLADKSRKKDMRGKPLRCGRWTKWNV